MPKAALALLLCVASSDAWFMYKAPGGVEFNASGHRSQYLALASRTVGVKGRVVAGLSDASRYFSVLAGGGKSDRRNAKPVVLARGGQWPHADPSVAVAWTGCRTLDMRDGCLAPKEGIPILNDTDLAHNLAVFRARGAYWAVGGRHRRGDPAGGVFVLGPADAVDALGAAPRTLAFRGDHAGCVERRPHFAPVCEFDGRFSVALSGDRLLLYARANVKGTALNASLRDGFGGRRVQATETVLDERFPRASTWAPFRPVTFLGDDADDAQIYFPAAQGNPLDGGRTVLGLFPVQAGDAAFVALAVSCDGYAFSPLERLVPSRVAAFGRGADHPAAGAFRVPVDLKHVREVFRVYIHHDVPGADGGGDWRTRRKAARRKRRRNADEDFYAHSRLASYDLAVDAVRASLNAGTAALVAAGNCGIGSDALLSVRRTAKRCRYPNLPTAPGACKFNLLHGVSYVPRRALRLWSRLRPLRRRPAMRRLLCLGVFAAVDALGSDKLFLGASGVRQLDRSGVRAVAANETDAAGWVVAFYAPWCGHCQHYAPSFRQFGAALAASGDALRAGAVSCTAEKKACSEFGVRSYPTVKAFGALGNDVVLDKRAPLQLLATVRRKYPGYLTRDDAALLKEGAAVEKGGGLRRAEDPPLKTPGLRGAPALSDAAASLRYALESAVFTEGPALSRERLVALRGVLAAASAALPGVAVAPALLDCLGASSEGVTSDEWDAWLAKPDAVTCRGRTRRAQPKAWSARCDPDGRGAESGGTYTCGLWSFFHAVVASEALEPRAARAAVRAFVAHFFGCAECRSHFLAMYDACDHGACDADGDASLWLWRAHNAVNSRVKGGGASDAAAAADAAAAWAWPPASECGHCRVGDTWDEAEVARFLRRTYGHAAAPPRTPRKAPRRRRDRAASGASSGAALVAYGLASVAAAFSCLRASAWALGPRRLRAKRQYAAVNGHLV